MNVPRSLTPIAKGKIALSNNKVSISKRFTTFPLWKGVPLQNTYGGKAVIDVGGKPVFAELAVLNLFLNNGWRGVWVDTYGKKFRVGLPDIEKPVELPKKQQEMLDRVSSNAGGIKGCWDLFLWKESDFLFVELKRKSKDAIRKTQIEWLEAAIKLGVSSDNFLLVEWDVKNHPK